MRYSEWLKSAPLALAASSTGATSLPDDLFELTVGEAAQLICRQAVSSRQLTEMWLQRIDAHAHLNAFISVDAQAALAKAEAYDLYVSKGGPCLPLGGVPIAVKDNIQVKGFSNTAGTPALAAFQPREQAPVIDRLEAAGAIIIGKTNMQELAYGTSGYNTAFHVPGVIGVRNAYDPSRIAGGSSSGSASAVGARLVPAALGTDTGGSIRQPCALNGCVGFRPSVGRYNQQGVTPISPTRDTVGPMTRSVEDAMLLDQVITGQPAAPARPPQGIRLGVPEQFWQELEPAVAVQARKALGELERAGVQLVPVSLPGLHELDAQVGMPIALYEGKASLQAYLEHSHSGVSLEQLAAQISSPDVRSLFEQFIMPQKIPTADGQVGDLLAAYRWAMDHGRAQMLEQYQAVFSAHSLDALIFPTTPERAILSNPQASSFAAFSRMIRNANPGSNVSLPGISLPAGLAGTPALPVGLEIDSLPHSDSQLLAIALTLQGILGRQPGPAL